MNNSNKEIKKTQLLTLDMIDSIYINKDEGVYNVVFKNNNESIELVFDIDSEFFENINKLLKEDYKRINYI